MTIQVNNDDVESFIFSGGECHVRLTNKDYGKHVNVTSSINNANDIMFLLLTIDALRQMNHEIKINLTIPYFPYARQDRVCYAGEAFSAKVMADLINAQKCENVTILDPHSNITPNLINNSKVKSLNMLIQESKLNNIIRQEKLNLVSPDAGALHKVEEISLSLKNEDYMHDLILAEKVRDPKDGTIKETRINSVLQSDNYIILDDICDGGRTFIELAKVLKENGAKKIYLYVSHGIFSKGFEELSEYFEKIYCWHLVGNKVEKENKILEVIGEIK